MTASLLVAAGLCLLMSGCGDKAATAVGLVAQKDYAGAEGVYRDILVSEPEDPSALSGLAVVLALQGKHDEALSFQERAIAADPSDVQTRIELGFNYLNHQGRSADAVRVLGEAAALDGSAKNLTFLGQAQFAAGREQEAQKTLERAIEVDPDYEYSYRVLVGLLRAQGRTDEAADVTARAASRGISIADTP